VPDVDLPVKEILCVFALTIEALTCTAWSATGPAFTVIEPADEATVIPLKKVFPEPDIDIFPVALTFPVGEMLVPPVIEIAPPEVSAPAPL
jgi:hypothetical protein